MFVTACQKFATGCLPFANMLKKNLMSTHSSGIFRKIADAFSWLKRMLSKSWNWYKRQFKGRPWWYKLWSAAWSFVAFIAFYIFAVIFNLFWLFGKSPSLNDILHPKTAATSEIYSADGKLLGKFFNENRSPVPYDSISPVFFQALIATEDERFYQHHGIDYQGLFAAAKDAMQGRARGASTITQQLVKNMFRVRTQYSTGLLGKIPGVDILVMKSKEMIIATEIEMVCDKREILEMYANTVDFGSNSFGIKTAAKTYFNTTPMALKAEEAAVLVGLLKATSAYNPRINPKNSLKRRNTVLNNMYLQRNLLKEHFTDIYVADKETLARLQDTPIKLNFNVEKAYDGKALYFREAVKEFISDKCPELDIYSDGLKIYTTLDSRMQEYGEQALREQMKQVQQNFDRHWRGLGDPWRDEKGQPIPGFIEDKLRDTEAYKMLSARFPNSPDSVDYYLRQPHKVKLFSYDGERTEIMSTLDSLRYMVKFMHAGFVAMEPGTGHVKAYVGDIDFKTWKYDKVQSMRQPGSTFKLFVYAAAMKKGLTPSDARKDEYIRMEVYDRKRDTTEVWQPHNANGRFSNREVPLRSAFAQSINTIAVKLGQEVGIPAVIETAHDMGIKSPLQDIPSLPLGASDVNLFELVNAYATVANDGVHVEPILVTKILDSEGHVVYESTRIEKRALSQTAAFYVQKLLEAGVRDGGGTSQTLRAAMYLGTFANQLDMGGKTGTSNNHSDAWFVGVTPGLVGGAWVGGEYRSIHFRTGALGQGSRTALPIVAKFMRSVMDDPALRTHYLRKYGLPPAGVDASTYNAVYVPSSENADSLADDSLSGFRISDDDLMDIAEHSDHESDLGASGEGQPSETPSADASGRVASQPGEPADKKKDRKSRKKNKEAKEQEAVESLFE